MFHRDFSQTACPGKNVYNQKDWIRNLIDHPDQPDQDDTSVDNVITPESDEFEQPSPSVWQKIIKLLQEILSLLKSRK
jgi:hypothetical protein